MFTLEISTLMAFCKEKPFMMNEWTKIKIRKSFQVCKEFTVVAACIHKYFSFYLHLMFLNVQLGKCEFFTGNQNIDMSKYQIYRIASHSGYNYTAYIRLYENIA